VLSYECKCECNLSMNELDSYCVTYLIIFSSNDIIFISRNMSGDKWWGSWLRHCATNLKVAGSILDEDIELFFN
jgi:hypothetical protein